MEGKMSDRIAKATLEVGGFVADKINKDQGYRYISADVVLERGGQALAKVGVTVVPQVSEAQISMVDRQGKAPRIDALIKMRMVVACADEAVTADWYGCGSDYATPDKALYKAITSGHKYFLMKLLNISVGNEDSEHEAEEKTPISHNRTPSQPNENSTENKPVDSPPSRPYDPITLLARLREKSKGHNGRKASHEQRGLCVSMLEIALGGETQRKEFSKWALGVASSKDVADDVILSLLDWLKPTKDNGGAYAPDAMACREAQLALTEALKASGQENLL